MSFVGSIFVVVKISYKTKEKEYRKHPIIARIKKRSAQKIKDARALV